jgi:broad specificity phosphatase PhoE
MPKDPRYFITLLRHGESVGNAELRLQGKSDFPLTETGRAQARVLAARWQAEGVRFDAILSSPLSRARETAEILAGVLGLPVETDPIWVELDFGKLSGLTVEEIHRIQPPSTFSGPYDAVGPDGESYFELFLRAGRALQLLLQRPPGKYLVVSHGGLLGMLMYAVVGITPQAGRQGIRFRLGNTGFTRLVYEPADHRWLLETFNDHSHWKEAEEENE